VAAEIFLVGAVLVVAVLLGRWLSIRLEVPEAAAYVVLGGLVGLLPGMAEIQLSPDVVLLLFLPPLIYYAGFYSDPRETVEHLPAVIGQSVGLVLVTAGTYAGALLLVFPDVGWAAALASGAAVAPPDPVAATNVLQRLGVPRRLVTVLEGEGLINDGIALTVFALAVTAVGASPTAGDVGLELLVQIGGGIAIGLVVGVASTWLRRRVTDSASHVVLSLATPTWPSCRRNWCTRPGCWPPSPRRCGWAPGAAGWSRPPPGCRPRRSGGP
jgi:NhaP-type Na+/H+ or K+/H+ antiporter